MTYKSQLASKLVSPAVGGALLIVATVGTSGVAAYPAYDYDPVAEMYAGWEVWAPDAGIRDAQKILRERGAYKGPVDGVMNPDFRRAVWNLQRQRGLPTTAALDEATVAAITSPDTAGSALPRR